MRVIREETLWEGDFIKTVLITYDDSKGRRRKWEAVGRVDCDGVVVVAPFTEDGEVLLIRQFRPVLRRYVIELPAGLVEKGEEPAKACLRELVEETGYQPGTLVPLTEGVMSTGINTETWHVFLALDARKATDELRRKYPPEEGEEIEVVSLPVDELYEALDAFRMNGDLIDLRIFGIIGLAKRKMPGGK